jgi:hypothetical protein
MKRLILLATLALAACEGTPFNPYGKTEQDECHPEKWLDVPQQTDSLLVAYQAACKAAREARNSQ